MPEVIKYVRHVNYTVLIDKGNAVLPKRPLVYHFELLLLAFLIKIDLINFDVNLNCNIPAPSFTHGTESGSLFS